MTTRYALEKGHGRKTNSRLKKALRMKLVSFLYKSYESLRRGYELLCKRYRKVEFPCLDMLKRQGDLYVAGAFAVWY
jgi:hypothetical protein